MSTQDHDSPEKLAENERNVGAATARVFSEVIQTGNPDVAFAALAAGTEGHSAERAADLMGVRDSLRDMISQRLKESVDAAGRNFFDRFEDALGKEINRYFATNAVSLDIKTDYKGIEPSNRDEGKGCDVFEHAIIEASTIDGSDEPDWELARGANQLFPSKLFAVIDSSGLNYFRVDNREFDLAAKAS